MRMRADGAIGRAVHVTRSAGSDAAALGSGPAEARAYGVRRVLVGAATEVPVGLRKTNRT